MLPGDVLKTVNGTALTFENNQQVFTDMFMWSPGTEIKVVLERDGKEFVIEKALTQSFTPGQNYNQTPVLRRNKW